MNPRVKNVTYEHPYMLMLTFNNGEARVFNFENYLQYPVYLKLKDAAFCRKVKPFMGTAVWDEEIDFDPDTLYLESKAVEEIPAKVS